MSLNFKNSTLLILIFCGFLFFFINVIKLNSNYKNIKIPESAESLKNEEELKDITNKSKVEADNSTNNFSKNENKPKNKETVIIVKKGQTFLSILDYFNFENNIKF